MKNGKVGSFALEKLKVKVGHSENWEIDEDLKDILKRIQTSTMMMTLLQ